MTDEELNNLDVRLTVSSNPGVAMEAAPRLLAEVRRLREEVAASRWSAWLLAWQAIGHTAAGVFAVDLALNAPPRSVCAHCQAEHEVESGAMAAHVRACPSNPLAQEVAAFKAEASLRDIAAVGVDKVNADIVAALKAEVARATDNARMFARAADTEKGNAAGFRAEVARLAGVAREACDVADRAIEANEILPSTNSEHIATLRASIPTPDPAAFVAAVDAYGQWCGTIGSSLATGGTARFLADCERERDAARAALLKLGGVR